jgi:hypothetical protein
MNGNREHFDNDSDFEISPQFSKDIKHLFRSRFSIPAEVDRAVLDKARQRVASGRRGHRILRHISIRRVAAAAAVIIFVFGLNLTRKPGPAAKKSLSVEARAVDIDRNGRVDILDAFKLARHIESSGRTEESWDINGDGRINAEDVDLVASAAVNLSASAPPVQKRRLQVDKGV